MDNFTFTFNLIHRGRQGKASKEFAYKLTCKQFKYIFIDRPRTGSLHIETQVVYAGFMK
jgi:hypothetical protein